MFKTNSDTEVILAGYSLFGKDFFKKLNGIYAIALWDSLKKKLTFAEMKPKEKFKIDHRFKAFRKVKKF